MEETATPATVSMQAAVPKKPAGKSQRSASALRAWIPRPAFVAIAFVLMLTVGWGAFKFLGRQSQSNEEAELADLETFEQDAPSLGAPESQTRSQLGNSSSQDLSQHAVGENAIPRQAPLTLGSNELPALFATPNNPFERFEQSPVESSGNPQTTSGAWLMGTIEDDAPQQIAMPPRVTPAAADGPLFR